MLIINVDISQLRRLNGQFASFTGVFQRSIQNVLLDTIGPQMHNMIAEATPVSDRTHATYPDRPHARYMWEIANHSIVGTGVGGFELKNKAPYIMVLEEGRSAGPIFARHAAKLRFWGDKYPPIGWVATPSVFHPGYEGRHFIAETFERNKNLILQRSEASVRITLNQILAGY